MQDSDFTERADPQETAMDDNGEMSVPGWGNRDDFLRPEPAAPAALTRHLCNHFAASALIAD
jgi:hypothetical protein